MLPHELHNYTLLGAGRGRRKKVSVHFFGQIMKAYRARGMT
jgi:hypothetical protein